MGNHPSRRQDRPNAAQPPAPQQGAPRAPAAAAPPMPGRRPVPNLHALQPDDAWNVRDLDILQYRYPQLRPPPTGPVQTSQHIRTDINLQRDSLTVTQDESDPHIYTVSCVVDTTVACVLKIYYVATRKPGGGYRAKSDKVTSIQLGAGLAQLCTQPVEEGIRVSDCSSRELSYSAGATSWPIVVTLETLDDDPQHKQIQTTFGSFDRATSGVYTAKAIKQEIMLRGTVYVLQEIYGMGRGDRAQPPRPQSIDEVQDDGSDCVVCMNEPREVMVLPCRHMCLCQGCADMLRFQSNKCPICRSMVQSLLRVRMDETEETQIPTPPRDSDTVAV